MQKEDLLLIAYSIVIVLALLAALIFIFVVFQRRKNRMLIERMEAQRMFEQELADARLEIQEQTLRNIAWELHDNIGQILAVANMQLSMLEKTADEEIGNRLRESKEMVGNAIGEVRALSRTLNSEVVNNNGLEASLEAEIDRFNRLKFLEASFSVSGSPYSLNPNDEILIFRILQEFFSNVIRHAQASKLDVNLCWKGDGLEVTASDDGAGFDPASKRNSSGLQNMESRARLLGANFRLESSPGMGTRLGLKYQPGT